MILFRHKSQTFLFTNISLFAVSGEIPQKRNETNELKK